MPRKEWSYKMYWFSKSIEDTLRGLETDKARGLDSKQALKRLSEYGSNALEVKKKKSLLRRFIEQLSDLMIIILVAAAILSLFVSIINGEADFVDPIIIVAIIIINATLGLVQESRAQHALESLQRLSSPKTSVLRDGKRIDIDSESLVKGDIIFLETGNRVTADARLIEVSGLRVEESSLTGESDAADKSARDVMPEDAALGERRNMVYSGSSIAGGRGKAVVTATGMETEVGKIASLIDSSEPPQTPLQRRLDGIGNILGVSALVLCGIVFLLGIVNKTDVFDSFMLSISLAVAAVPEGLPAIVTIVLSLGVQKMAKNNAIVRKLPAVETLGSATVICSDKTGTLTQNKMQVRTLWTPAASGDSERKLITYGTLCCNSTISKVDGKMTPQGDPTENAIVTAAADRGVFRSELEERHPRVQELPFDSARKLMSTINKLGGRGNVIITKGAPDVLLPLCSQYEKGGASPMTAAMRNTVSAENATMAAKALRVIAVAYRNLGSGSVSATNTAERDLVFLGLIAMIDPPRPEARDAVTECKLAGIRPVMITGDHAATASAIAGDLGILRGADSVISGRELDKMDDKELERTVNSYSVFARVSPEHKSRVVRALQANDEIVAMTGDGVNDAPALKVADIGCAMGITGTDVARDASDMILTDDNFATIVSAVREGRGIYQNICKSIHFLLSCNVGEILTILLAFALGMPSPLLPIHLLWINLVTDSLPALAIGAEKPDRDIMDRRPVNPRASMFGDGMGFDIITQGIMIGVISLAAFMLGLKTGDYGTARTYTFAVLSISQLVHAFNIRSSESLFSIGFLSNIKLVGAFVICLIMQLSVICVPTLAGIFRTVPLSVDQWKTVAVLALVPLVAVEAGKLLFGGKRRKNRAKSS